MTAQKPLRNSHLLFDSHQVHSDAQLGTPIAPLSQTGGARVCARAHDRNYRGKWRV